MGKGCVLHLPSIMCAESASRFCYMCNCLWLNHVSFPNAGHGLLSLRLRRSFKNIVKGGMWAACLMAHAGAVRYMLLWMHSIAVHRKVC